MRKILSYTLILLTMLAVSISAPDASASARTKKSYGSYSKKTGSTKTKKVKTSGMDPDDIVYKYAGLNEIGRFVDGAEYVMMSDGYIKQGDDDAGYYKYENGCYKIALYGKDDNGDDDRVIAIISDRIYLIGEGGNISDFQYDQKSGRVIRGGKEIPVEELKVIGDIEWLNEITQDS